MLIKKLLCHVFTAKNVLKSLLQALGINVCESKIVLESLLPALRIKLLEALVGYYAYVYSFIRARMARVSDFMLAPEQIYNPHVFTEMRRIISIVEPFVQILRATSSDQTRI